MRSPFYIQNLTKDMDHWISQGWVPANSRDHILDHVQSQKSGRNVGNLLAMLGVVLLGFAAISFVAANWADMGKLLRVGLILGAMWAAYGISAIALHRKVSAYAQSFGLLGAALFGAAIMLIAQTFNIQAHYPDGVLIWCLGALATAWVLPSRAVLIFSALLAGLWMQMSFFGDIPTHLQNWLYPLLATIIGWSARRMRSAATMNILSISLLLFIPFMLIHYFGEDSFETFQVFPVIAGCYIIVALLASYASSRHWFGSSVFTGWMALGALVIGFVQQFALGDVDPALSGHYNYVFGWLSGAIWALIAVLALVLVRINTIQRGLAIGIVAGSGLLLFSPYLMQLIGELPVQLIHGAAFFALSVALLIRGMNTHSRSLMWIGGVGFTAQANYVYFETFKDLLSTSLFFLIGGVLLLGLSVLALRLNKQLSKEREL